MQQQFIKNILVPTNFSAISENAIYYAAELAKNLGANIQILHSYQALAPDYQNPNENFEEEAEQKAKMKLDKLCSDIQNKFAVKCDFIFVKGMPEEAILSHAESKDTDILVLGTESLTQLERIIFGSVRGEIFNEAQCSLLMIPQNAYYHPLKKIAFASDYHDSDLIEISQLMQVAEKFGSNLHIIHVLTESNHQKYEESFFEDFQQKVRQLTFKNQIVFNLLQAETVSKELQKYVGENEIDLLAVAKTRKSKLEKILAGSLTQKLFFNSKIPLLVFQEELI